MQLNNIILITENITSHDWFDYLTLITSFLGLIISAILTIINIKFVNKNTNKQIENQNKETYKPRLKVESIENIFDNPENEKMLYAYSIGFDENKNNLPIYFDLCLQNIGYGIANEITFYMLNSGEKCLSKQFVDITMNQQLNSTMEIPKDSIGKIRFDINFNKEQIDMKDCENNGDIALLICNYKDLNNNNYKILIGLRLKRYDGAIMKYYEKEDRIEKFLDLNFDFYYYQEDSENFNKVVFDKRYITNYQNIIKQINNKETYK